MSKSINIYIYINLYKFKENLYIILINATRANNKRTTNKRKNDI